MTEQTEQTEQTEPADRPKWWRRVRGAVVKSWKRSIAALAGPEQPPYVPPAPPEPPGRLLSRRTITPIDVPAQGFAFDFQLSGVFEWRSNGLERATLDSLVERFLPYARAHLKEEATGLARDIEPHRGDEFERRLRQRLDQLGAWRYERGGQQVTCRAYVRVQLDERVRQHIQPYWERLITLDYEHDLATRRAKHADGVSTEWAKILHRLLDGPVPGGAARMTDQQLAEVVRELLADRAAATDPLSEALKNLDPQDEYAREGYFDLFSGRGRA